MQELKIEMFASKFNLNSFSKLARTNNIPIKIVTKEDEMKL
jgi:hypothetical protein